MDANLLVTRGRTIIEGERRKRRRLSGEAALAQQLARGEETSKIRKEKSTKYKIRRD